MGLMKRLIMASVPLFLWSGIAYAQQDTTDEEASIRSKFPIFLDTGNSLNGHEDGLRISLRSLDIEDSDIASSFDVHLVLRETALSGVLVCHAHINDDGDYQPETASGVFYTDGSSLRVNPAFETEVIHEAVNVIKHKVALCSDENG